ncbi:MAG: Mur ligase family protein [Patescibacteria group bacterium]
MSDWKEFFRGKTITVMGLGLLGRGVGDAEFLAKFAKEIIVTDLKTSTALESSLARLRKFKNIKYVLGKHRLEDFKNRDFIIKAAGVPLDSPYITHARKHKMPVYMSTALFAYLSPSKIIGVTGTRGKTTVTYMLYEILKRAKKGRVYLGGNVQGMATLPMLAQAKKDDVYVLELDSWQLQGFGDLKISPPLSVFTNFMPDHLNYYKNDLKKYFGDKANIFKYQKRGDILIVGENLKKIPKRAIRISESDLPRDIILQIPGKHNRFNAALAYVSAKKFGIPIPLIKKSLREFKGVSGRLEKIRDYKGVEIYNDTTATTPHALKIALEALNGKQVILIAGGSDKNIGLALLKKPLTLCKKIILFPGSGTDRLIKEKIVKQFILAKEMNDAVQKAFRFTTKGEAILLSPGFASFGLFKNEYDRGEKFVTAIKKFTK